MKKQYVKSAMFMAALAGMVGLTSCENKNEMNVGNQPSGIMTEATMGVSVRPSISSKSSPDDVNMGTAIKDINNIAIIPMVGSNYANPISLGNLTGANAATGISKTASIDQNTDGFIVYGGLLDPISENTAFVPANQKFTLQEDGSVSDWGSTPATVYSPYSLFYFLEAKAGDNNIETAETGTDWASASYSALGSGLTVGEAKYIKVKNVRYGVGALAVAVLDGVDGTTDIDGADGEQTWDDVKADIALAGMTINNHPAELDYKFDATGTATQPVYVSINAGQSGFVADRLTISDGKVTGANYYAPVAQCGDADHDVTLTFRFQNNSGESIFVGKEMAQEVTNGAYFYMNAIVRYEGSEATNTFAKFTTTLVNATLKDLTKATTDPVEPTEAEIGIEVNTDWETGHVYDVEM